MSFNFNWRTVAAIAAVLLLASAGTAVAQQTSGNVFVTVTDTQGEELPGVRVTLTGQGAPQTQFTDAQGQARFLGLSPGFYSLTAELQGFSTVDYPNVSVNTGRNTTLELTMSAAVEETITVTSESPLLDERKISTGSTVTQVELEKIPTARDPWVILQSVPGVLVDRVNVGGNESGQQSNFVGPGVGRGQSSWAVDGVVITDPAARGSSPTYYNFDAFEEMSISTGGTDISAQTAGVQLNLVTKRGTNQWRGEGRYLVSDSSWQSDLDVNSSDLADAGPWNAGRTSPGGNAQPAIVQGASTEGVDDYGLEIGGPVVRDRVWIWGTYGVQDVEAFQLGSGDPVPDNTELESYAAKLNAQITSSNSAVAFYHYGDKIKNGRGAGPTRPQPTTWNQTGPTDIYKLEDTQIFNSNLFVTGLVSYVGGGFQLIPVAGLGTDPSLNLVLDSNGVWNNSFIGYQTERPQEQARLDGSYFFNTADVNHELKFGIGYRNAQVESLTTYPGEGLYALKTLGARFGPGRDQFLGIAQHNIFTADEFDVWSVLLQDTITWGNATINAGLRYDLQQPTNLDATQPALRADPTLIPEFTRPGGDPGFEWESITPRVGITYAVGEDRDTLLRASYSRFADQLTTGFFADAGVNVIQYAYFYWNDANNDNIIQPGERTNPFGVVGDRTQIANTIDPGLDPQITDELLLGVEHALMPEFVVGVNATFRQSSDSIISLPKVQDANGVRVANRSDFEQVGFVRGTLPDGTGFNEPVYALRPGVSRDPARGIFRTNSDIGTDYFGLALTFNKRLSNRWMLRGFVNYADWTNDVPSSGVTYVDPTRGINTRDGSQVLVQSAGSGTKDEVWINSQWSANVSGMYQVAPDRPWGFNVSADVNLREGYVIPYRTSISSRSSFTGDQFGRTVVVAPEQSTFRNDDLILVNARIEKEFTFGDWGLTLGADVFNLFNTSNTLQTESVVTSEYVNLDGTPFQGAGPDFFSTNADFIRETVAPRIFRLGARISFN